MAEHLLEVNNLKQYFPVSKSYTVKAVDGVSFYIDAGETYGLVGESGSGKSTIGRAIIRLYDPTDGTVTFDGQVISGSMSESERKLLRTKMQMIFQDPMACLNPRKKVSDIIGQGLDVHNLYSTPQERQDKIYRIMEKIGLAREHANRYPHQFSGGQRQRIGIARSLYNDPDVLIMDEATSALDNDTEAAIIESINRLHGKKTLVIIAHRLQTIENCDMIYRVEDGKVFRER